MNHAGRTLIETVQRTTGTHMTYNNNNRHAHSTMYTTVDLADCFWNEHTNSQ